MNGRRKYQSKRAHNKTVCKRVLNMYAISNTPFVDASDDAGVKIALSPVPSLDLHAWTECNGTQAFSGHVRNFFSCVEISAFREVCRTVGSGAGAADTK